MKSITLYLLFMIGFCFSQNSGKNPLLYFGSNDSVAFIGKPEVRCSHQVAFRKCNDIQKLLYWNVYDFKAHEEKLFSAVVSAKTFERIDAAGSYYRDENFIYIYARSRNSLDFIFIPKSEGSFKGEKYEYLFTKDKVYWNGLLIEGVNAKQAKLIYKSKKDGSKTLEFLACEKKLYYGAYPVRKEQLKRMDLAQENEILAVYIFDESYEDSPY